ncbi:hypothetical protein ACLKA6_012682 [Drosophila palustris]
MTLCDICKEKYDPYGSDDNWVQCDKCKQWFHFICVGVDESVKDRDWNCTECTKQIASEHMVHANPNRILHSPVQQGTTSKERTSQQVEVPNNEAILKIDETSSHQEVSNTSMEMTGHQQQLMLAMLAEKRAAEERYIEQKYQLLARMNPAEMSALSGPSRPFQASENSLSSSQVSARHAIPKDLPTFSGDPEEWPIFISTFNHSTSVAGFSHTENMMRLQKCLKGKARDLVKDRLLIPSMVPEVISALKMFFGRPEHILERLIEKVRKLQPPKDKLEALIEFSLAVRNICATMEACKLDAHLNNPMLAKELIDKLPSQHKLSWAMRGQAMRQDSTSPIIKEFSDWLYQIAEAASTVVSPIASKTSTVNAHTESTSTSANQQNQQSTAQGGTSVPQQHKKQSSSCIACASTEHFVAQCDVFQRSTVKDRWEIVKAKRVCFRCLKNHRQACFIRKPCELDGCTKRHHPLLHGLDTVTPNTGSNQAIVSTHQTDSTVDHYFRIVPVNLHAAGKTIRTYAFLDEGSSVTLIDEATFDMLGIKGEPMPLCLQWTSETTRNEAASVRASMQISACSSSKRYWLNNVHTVRNIALPKQKLNALGYLK